jgi:hypothetical protein
MAARPPPPSAPVQVEAKPAPPPPPAPSPWRKVGLGMMIAAPVVAAVGLYYGSHARDQARKIEDACRSGCAGGDIIGTDSARRENGTRQWVLLGAGAAVLAGGVALFFASSF